MGELAWPAICYGAVVLVAKFGNTMLWREARLVRARSGACKTQKNILRVKEEKLLWVTPTLRR